MQQVSFRNTRHRPHRAKAAAALLGASTTLGGPFSQALAECPWIVQPFVQAQGTVVEPRTYEIVFDGLGEGIKVFYGFTVASVDLAWRLVSESALPELRHHARRLEAKSAAGGRTTYQLASDTIEPYIIYLVAADSKVDQLEGIKARIEPSRPIELSQLSAGTRGASDMSGALPHRSVPGVEIASAKQPPSGDPLGPDVAGVQICAYEVAMR